MTVAPSIRRSTTASLDEIVAAYSEVTERLRRSHECLAGEVRRLHEQLDEKNRELARRKRLAALGEMAAGVAHEIRNPLSGINLFADALCRDLADRPECKRLAERIVAGVRTLEAVVGDILAFAGLSSVKLQPVPLDAVIGAVVELAEPERRASGATIHVPQDCAGAKVFSEFSQLQRAVLNMTLNAIDATGRDGHVWISLSREGTETSIDIADDGPGIEAAILDRVFDPFFTDKGSGTGLGLAIVHRIAEAHGGRVSAGSRPGGGALFRLKLRSAP